MRLCYDKQAEKDYENMQDMPDELSLYPLIHYQVI